MKQLIISVKNTGKNEDGFIALTSAIILGALLLTLTLALSTRGFFARSAILDSEFKERSTALAEACVETTLLKLTENTNYAGGETITVGTETCEIKPLESSSGEKTIKTTAEAGGAVTNLIVKVNDTTFGTVSWLEVPNF